MNKIMEIMEKIDVNKETLLALPKNNKKNMTIYMKRVEELKNEYTEYQNIILKEIEKRYKKIDKKEENAELIRVEEELDNSEGILYLLNDIETSFEKMDLDKAIQNLSYYYRKNLEIVNDSIIYIIKKFKEVGVELKKDDFCYNNYVKEYISLFFDEIKDEKIEIKQINSKFEEIYWKCPDIITYIELNIRFLYLKNEKTIDKYYAKQKSILLKNFTSKDICDRYSELRKQLIENIKQDKVGIIRDFLNGKLNPKDFEDNVIKQIYLKFIEKDTLENADENKMDEIDNNLSKLSNTIYEYKNYLNFKYIIEDIKRIYQEKDKYKNLYNEKRKEITKNEQKIIKLNNSINKKSFFKKSNEKANAEQNKLILETKALYKALDENKVYNKVFMQLKDTSTISDILYLASSFYKYLFDCIRKTYKNMQEEEIDKIIEQIREFVKWPYTTIINNIDILADKDILLIIKDRYQLLNINITKEELEEENLDNLISTIETIEIMHSIKKNKIDINEIKCMCDFKKILNK